MNVVILLDHGSRAEGSAQNVQRVAAALTARVPTIPVLVAHRELCEPSLEQVVAQVVAQGAQRITILPYFLHFGLHMQEDVPGQLAALRSTYPKVSFILAEHLGYDERLVDILQDRLTTALDHGT